MKAKFTIPLNKPFLTGKETTYIEQAVLSGRIAGDGSFTQRCHQFFSERYGFKHNLLTTSCSDALELAALTLNITAGDEVIVPTYTFVSTANAFALRGAKLIFADSCADHPNIDPQLLPGLITPKTKVIVVVHYAGMACSMDEIIAIAAQHNVAVVEDAAQAINSFYKKDKPLGSLGSVATFSFHETKNIISGEGGLLVVNDTRLMSRAEILREKGTNRSAFFRDEVSRYEWLMVGSSFLPSDIISAFLYAQLEHIDHIQQIRVSHWLRYTELLAPLAKSGMIALPQIPEFASLNGNIFYLLCNSRNERDQLIAYLRDYGIYAAFHYLCLHTSPYFKEKHDGRELVHAKRIEETLVRLPLYFGLTAEEQDYICECIHSFYGQNRMQ
jgi:dTDP-4-amino-4,6-dideoxygalactose transaminase